ncbi:hypothetical protein GCM10022409_41010 [Hymenobacter glaciei]|uniref:GSCFA domain-containing protein n=2 Tax=Hymenobacter glaciei TaxID=877209 RepID=A0ABP7UQJ7_9BACT
MGSCFADSIGARLEAHKVETRVNPFGTVFQPLALARLLRAAAGEEVDWQQHLVQARGRWQSYDLHGSVGADSPVELLQYIQEVVRQTGDFLRNTDLVLLTLGTAWAYRLRETGELVNNCHKQPADLFVRELLTPDEIINALAETHAYLRRINPELRFVLTVSPVRHLKDTLPLNSVSKSVLRVATHIVSDLLPGVAYFPAFELLTDDLRDYRFYAADMLHPSEVAEDYIWDKFARTYFDADFGRFRKEWTGVRQALGHRPLHEGAPEHRQFLESTREKLEQLSLRKVDVANELRSVHARLEALPLPAQPERAPEPEDDEERIDIGEGAVGPMPTPVPENLISEAPGPAQLTESQSRPPRLSPEEFRAQRAARPERGRRDGRGKGQPAQPTETEQFQAPSFKEADEYAQQPSLTESVPVELAPVALAPDTPEALDAAADVADMEAGRKKKRRSRGGAKRTARKHALRLAAEMGLDEGQLAASAEALETAAEEMPIEVSASMGATQAESTTAAPAAREPRPDRRNEGGRGVARVPLFAAAAAPATNATPEDPAVSTGAPADSEQETPNSSSRKSRNRKKKKGNRPVAADAADADHNSASAPTPRGAVEAVVDQEALIAARSNDRRGNRQPQEQPVATLPMSGATPAVAATPVVLVSATSDTAANEPNQATTPAVPKAAKPSKRKSRAQVGGRTEKPAIDSPIIPADDTLVLRSQVAAGRLTGTSASLVEPTTPAKQGAPKPRSKKALASKTVTATETAQRADPSASSAPIAPAMVEASGLGDSSTGGRPKPKAKTTPGKPAAAETVAPAKEMSKPAPSATPAKAVDAATTPMQGAAGKKVAKATGVAQAANAPAKPAKAPKVAAKPVAIVADKAAAPTIPSAEPTAKRAPKPLVKPALPAATPKAKPVAKTAKATAEPTPAKPTPARKAPAKAGAEKADPGKKVAAKAKVPKKPAS